MFSAGTLFKSKTHSFMFLYLTLTTRNCMYYSSVFCLYDHQLQPGINNICVISAKAVIHELLIV